MSAIRTYKKGECIVFRSTKEKFGGLSNMAPGYPIIINGIEFRTSEALYQSLRYPRYPEIQQQIIVQKSPISAKMKSKKYYEFTRIDWMKIRFVIMKFCLEIKLQQNWDKLYEVLLSTEHLPIVEEAPDGKVWGAVLKGDYYIGTNALGRLLMQLREDYVFSNKTSKIFIPSVGDLFLLGKEITSDSLKFDKY